MQRWNKTVMTWGCNHLDRGLVTDIPIPDWPFPQEKPFHVIHGVNATALPDRNGQIELCIRRQLFAVTTEGQNILHRLKSGIDVFEKSSGGDSHLCHRIDVVAGNDLGAYNINFTLRNGEQFCESALAIVREIFSLLGVKDERGYELSDFTITQEMFAMLDGQWISFANMLRIRNRLPVRTGA